MQLLHQVGILLEGGHRVLFALGTVSLPGGFFQVHARAEDRARPGQNDRSYFGIVAGSVELILEFPHQGPGKGVAPIGTIKRENGDRTIVRSLHQDFAHGVISTGSPDGRLSEAGRRSSKSAIPSAFPCVSSRSDRLAPPARAFSITKLNARKWGTSYCRTLPI